MKGLNEGIQKTSKLLTVAEASKHLRESESVPSVKLESQNLEDIPEYEAKLKKYYKYKALFAEQQDTVNKPLVFFHIDSAETKKNDINTSFGIDVAKILQTKLGARDAFKIILNTEKMKATFKDILSADGKKVLDFRKNIAA